MALTTLVLINGTLAALLVWALLQFLARGIGADRHDRTVRAAETRALPVQQRDRIAA